MNNQPEIKEETHEERIERIAREMDEVDPRFATPPDHSKSTTQTQENGTPLSSPKQKQKPRFVLFLNETQKAQLAQLKEEIGFNFSDILRNALFEYYNKYAKAGYVRVAEEKAKIKNRTPEEKCIAEGGKPTFHEGIKVCMFDNRNEKGQGSFTTELLSNYK